GLSVADRLGFLLGHWRGRGWTVVGPRTVEFEQEEQVRAVLGGALVTVEGRATAPGDPQDVRFTAFAIARYDAEAGVYAWRAYSPGGWVEVPLHVGSGTFGWGYDAAPGVPVRFEATVEGDTRR